MNLYILICSALFFLKAGGQIFMLGKGAAKGSSVVDQWARGIVFLIYLGIVVWGIYLII